MDEYIYKVCCIIDFDGFGIKRYHASQKFKHEFLIREVGFVKVDPVIGDFLAKSFHFDLTFCNFTPGHSSWKSINYQSERVNGLTLRPQPGEVVHSYNDLHTCIKKIYQLCRIPERYVVAFKGGNSERELLDELDIPNLDLTAYGCPKYETLVKEKMVFSYLRDCGHHKSIAGCGTVVHCPMSEVTAFRDWLLFNYPSPVIRETWAHPSVTQPLDMSVAFGIGPAESADSQRTVDWEAEIYGDLFQDGGFLQTLKTARGACSPLPEFVLKIDDDVFVNTHSLTDFLTNIETFSSSNTMWCLEWNRKLDRIGSNATWIVQSSVSNDSIHPAYCLSAIYLMTGRALDAIIRRHESKAQSSRFQLPDDVYVTSVLAREGHVSVMAFGDRYVYDPQVEEVDFAKLTLAHLGRKAAESETKKLWATLVKNTLNYSRRFDIGL